MLLWGKKFFPPNKQTNNPSTASYEIWTIFLRLVKNGPVPESKCILNFKAFLSMYIHILVYTILSAHSFVGYMGILVSIMLNTDFENVHRKESTIL